MTINYRYEIKFVLDDSKLTNALQWLHTKTTFSEKYNDRRVNSLYLDDTSFSSARDNLTGIPDKEKIRLRWYDEANKTPSLEIKIKSNRLGYKKLFQIDSLKENFLEKSTKEITSECIKTMKRNNIIFDSHLVPVLQLGYDRKYFEDKNGIRLTIDRNVCFHNASLHHKLSSKLPIAYSQAIMEIKFDPHLKDKVADLMRPLHITPKRHSKYLTGLAMLGKVVYL